MQTIFAIAFAAAAMFAPVQPANANPCQWQAFACGQGSGD